jgi:TPP-dependent pyruvate/acetoin dehydrogenase alpha subunit
MNNLIFLDQMLLIRRFEERLLDLFSTGDLSGTTHTCIGQEANAVSVINNLSKNDLIFSNHRCHGHYLALTEDVSGLLAEIMGKQEGVCSGRGGSQHIHFKNFFSNGVQGNIFPVAAGMAYAEKIKASGNIAVIFIGDGTFGEGIIYETLNLISLWEVPILIVVENNQYAQTTAITQNFSGSFSGRAKAFDISFGEIESNDVNILYPRFKDLVLKVRKLGKPHIDVLHTYRLAPHSKGDDFRDPEEIQAWKLKDPIRILSEKLNKNEIYASEEKAKKLINEAEILVKEMQTANQTKE